MMRKLSAMKKKTGNRIDNPGGKKMLQLRILLHLILIGLTLITCTFSDRNVEQSLRQNINFNLDWQFMRSESGANIDAGIDVNTLKPENWETVTLPVYFYKFDKSTLVNSRRQFLSFSPLSTSITKEAKTTICRPVLFPAQLLPIPPEKPHSARIRQPDDPGMFSKTDPRGDTPNTAMTPTNPTATTHIWVWISGGTNATPTTGCSADL